MRDPSIDPRIGCARLREIPVEPPPGWLDASSHTNLRRVAPGLYVGGYFAVRHAPRCARAVLDLHCGGWPPDFDPPPDFAALNAARLDALTRLDAELWLPISDSRPADAETFDRAYDFVRRHRPRGVLINCFAGISRSVALAYLAVRKMDGLGHEAALAACRHWKYAPQLEPLGCARDWVEGRP